jgi:hypothetical protein
MKAFEYCIETMQEINKEICGGHTGPANVFADKVGLRKRTFHAYMAIMRVRLKKSGIDITYSTALKTYQYTGPGKFKIFFDWDHEEK